jgi:hypothetical protein
MQVIINMEETLSEYYEKVKGRSYDIFLILELSCDVYNRCPICGGMNCAQFIGYYVRKVVDENGKKYDDFPIARFLCNRKGTEVIVNHKTFSLLPFQLIPYHKYCIDFMVKTLKLRYVDGHSIYDTLDNLAISGEDSLSTGAGQVIDFAVMVKEAIDKILARGYYHEFDEKIFQDSSLKEQIKNFIEFSEEFECVKVDSPIEGPCALGYDFYLSGGGYLRNAHFLFGTPSQFRYRGG